MTKERLAGIDLNLLTVFRAVHRARHVGRAARALGLSQPALSHALRRLRTLVGDPLFLKTAHGMVPTPLAEEIAPSLEAVLGTVERVLTRRPFVPAELTRTFVLRTTDFAESILAPRLVARLAADAPYARIAATAVGIALPAADLESGACDLAIAGFFGDLPPAFRRAPLFRDVFSCAVRAEHPRLRAKKPSLDAFVAERHLLVAPSGQLEGAVDRALAAQARSRAVVAGASGFMVAGWMTAESDCVLTAPSRLLAMLARYLPLRTFVPPIALAPIDVAAVWHARMDDDPAHRWLREQCLACCLIRN